MIAKMILAELASGVSQIVQKYGERWGARPQIAWAVREVAAGSCRCAADTCQ